MSRLVGSSLIGSNQTVKSHTLLTSTSTSTSAAGAVLGPSAGAGHECSQLEEWRDGAAYEEQLYVSLSTFWYCFLAFITTLGLLVSLVSNMIIIYLFTK